ncbi:MAG: flagellar hook-associated protein FlgK [Actinomycetes bacterium]|jgi:flagellar hook-associated protein 1 FlgK|nr:MAG: flagellar hook-associated protein FlgK [Actinomycetota bacterium]
MSDFLSLHTALSGVLAARAGVETTSHNVANAHSTGYTRQRIDQASREHGIRTSYGVVGTGTTVTGIDRLRNEFLDMRVRAGLGLAAGLDVRASLLRSVEDALAEPELGISSALAATWNSFEDLALNPTDPAARRNVIATLTALATRINTVADNWSRVESDAMVAIQQDVNEVNRLLHEVAGLNDAIRRSEGLGATPNDLLDRRDVALDRLAELVGATSRHMEDGTVKVQVNGLTVVLGTQVSELEWRPLDLEVMHPSGVPLVPGGSVGEYRAFLSETLPAFREQFSDFVEHLAHSLNQRHTNGADIDGNPGTDLFFFDRDPFTFELLVTDPDRLAASGIPFALHDGSNAASLAALREEAEGLVGDPATRVNLDSWWREIVTDIGVRARTAQDAASAQTSLQNTAELARLGAHGVSIDEEMVALIEYQHAYQASARVMTAVDELLDQLITRTGIVGR